MKPFFYSLALMILFSCNRPQAIVKAAFIDSVLTHFAPSTAATVNENDLAFWQNRVDSLPDSFVDKARLASALAGRFHIYGNIADLKKADSLMQEIALRYKEPGMYLSLAGYRLSQHRFAEAKKYIDTVVQMKAEKYATQMMLFDASFELGDEYRSAVILKANYAPKDYAYNFRLSKQDHYRGMVDSAIAHMLKAAGLAWSSPYLKTAALSNAADLYLHSGELEKAAALYEECVRFNSCDFHSLMGLGWIAAVHDGNDSVANRIFLFIQSHIKSPEPLLKLAQIHEQHNPDLARRFALGFVKEVSRPEYGNMYNKYLIEVYTSVLNEPSKALAIAQQEIENRSTPQTGCWLAWALFCNGRKTEAYDTYHRLASGKALEGLELYWMGKMMKGLGKGYNAQQFFDAAEKNKYDLSPAMRADLEKNF